MTSPDCTKQTSTGSSQRRFRPKQLAAYAVAAAGSSLAAEESSAAVIPIQLPGGQPVVIVSPDPGNVDAVFDLDVNSDGVDDYQFLGYLGVNLPNIFDLSGVGLNRVATDYMVLDVRRFSAGELIDDNSVVINGFTALETSGSFFDNFNGTRGFSGVLFDIPGGSLHYGYLDVRVDQPNDVLTLFGGAWESEPGVGIVAGAIPEPSGLGLLAMGAVGVAAWRRRHF